MRQLTCGEEERLSQDPRSAAPRRGWEKSPVSLGLLRAELRSRCGALTCEAEVRFGTPMPVLEDTLKKAVVAASDVLEKVCTFQDVEKQIQPHGAKHFLISEMEVPEDVVFNSPHIYFSSEKILVHGDKPHELIRVNGTTENALVMCLT
ncbi:hypothetical protein HPB47_002279 [Ixodes persulcatus]|uniref:Uncharacterized protein n=1 Tax=Ixodes persulcatus TaxID=34615 RepID=A0AC60PLT1_IXOPE|nr:hypothetical protein HPB47_002279 [Ixodes persulcatus]